MKKALIGVGTNLGDKMHNIEDAVAALNRIPKLFVKRASSVYETEPWGFKEQSNFYNAVLEVETELSPRALLGVCLGIEGALGRIREFKNGPRIIDLDILLYEGETLSCEELTVPHKFLRERDFVLVPLKELFCDLKIFDCDFSKDYAEICKNSQMKAVGLIDLKG